MAKICEYDEVSCPYCGSKDVVDVGFKFLLPREESHI